MALSTVAVFASCAFFLTSEPVHLRTSDVNLGAVRVILPWTVVLAAGMLVFRVRSRRPICV